MAKKVKDLTILAGFLILVTILVWLPHLTKIHSFYNLDFSPGFSTIYKNFDGLEYIIIAKTFYNPTLIAQIPQPKEAIYYASHFPMYPLLIAGLSPILGYLKSMLFITTLFTIFSIWAFYFLVKDFGLSKYPLWLSVVFTLLPGRWLIVHSIGSPEPIFIFFLILAVYFFLKFEATERIRFIWYSSFAAAATQLTRPPGILLFVAVVLYIHWKIFIEQKRFGLAKAIKRHLRYTPYILVPLTLLGVFYLYGIQYGDSLAYFHSGDNIHLTFPPFQIFNKQQFWVGDIWLEDVVYIFLIGFLGGLYLVKQKLYPIAFVVLTYLAASTLVAHRDISRYTLPIFPFVIIAFEKVLVSREFKIVLSLIVLGIYLYAQNYIINNIAPIPNLSVFN